MSDEYREAVEQVQAYWWRKQYAWVTRHATSPEIKTYYRPNHAQFRWAFGLQDTPSKGTVMH